MSETIDGTAVEVGTDLELAAPAPPPTTLFRTDDPAEVIVRATAAADALKSVLTSRRLISKISGKDYVRVEGWTTLGSMLGVVPHVVWTRPVEGGWEARVEARTLDGRTVGAGEAMCVEAEGGNWGSKSTSNARRSMAQTRATSKALRGPLGFVVTLAGYEATPAEEMSHVEAPSAPPVDVTPVIDVERATGISRRIAGLMRDGALDGSGLNQVMRRSGASYTAINAQTIAALTEQQAKRVEDDLLKLEENGPVPA